MSRRGRCPPTVTISGPARSTKTRPTRSACRQPASRRTIRSRVGRSTGETGRATRPSPATRTARRTSTPMPAPTRSRLRRTKTKGHLRRRRWMSRSGRAADGHDQRTGTVNEEATYTLSLSATGRAVQSPDHELDDQLGRRDGRPNGHGQSEQRDARLRRTPARTRSPLRRPKMRGRFPRRL